MTTRQATWLGGPWDGRTIELDPDTTEVPALDPGELLDGDPDDVELELVDLSPRPRRCPVLEQPDGRLVVDWHAGVTE